MTIDRTDVVIIGAGPYGLSIGAHLRKFGVPFRIFGVAMHSWREKMPAGMCLKSDGFASNLFDPDDSFTLEHFSKERGLEYAHIGHPVPIQTFVDYGMEFQKRLVPNLEESTITQLKQTPDGFSLLTDQGETLLAKKVVLAVGITYFSYIPPQFAGLGPEHLSHTSEHTDPAALRGRSVAVIGAGASAVDLAALMKEAGVDVQLIARREKILFHSPPGGPRPLLQRVMNPRSGLGFGWRSKLSTDLPLVFHAMPENLRLRAVRNHLGPAPGWFVRDKIVNRVPLHMNATLTDVALRGGQVNLTYQTKGQGESTLAVDHVVAGTGYQTAIKRLSFLDEGLKSQLRTVEETPILKRNFESSVPGLFFVGLASANSFGPLARFALGAGFTARRVSASLR